MPKFVGENIWTEDNPNAYFPRPQAYISTGSQDLSYAQTKYLQNAAYLRLKNLTMGYTLPNSLTKNYTLKNYVYILPDRTCSNLRHLPMLMIRKA